MFPAGDRRREEEHSLEELQPLVDQDDGDGNVHDRFPLVQVERDDGEEGLLFVSITPNWFSLLL
jgi:hypothetical protein